MTEATTIIVPLWAAGVTALSVLGTTIGGTIWVMQTFQSKADAARDREEIEKSIEGVANDASDRSRAIESRFDKMEDTVGKVARDVSYIRGRIEKGARPGG